MKFTIGYLLAVFISVLYARYLDGETGVILLVFMIAFPLLSYIFAMVSAKFTHLSFDVSESLTGKHKSITCTVNIRKTIPFLSPCIDLSLEMTPHISSQNSSSIRIFSGLSKDFTSSYKFSADICGKAHIRIHSAFITDYFGIYKFNIRHSDTSLKEILIMPDVPDTHHADNIMRAVINNNLINDEDEEYVSESSYSGGSIAGFEHREYVPGDPVKRINWKLSARKNKLMLRLDEKISSSKPIILIDTFLNNSPNLTPLSNILYQQRIVEAALAISAVCTANGIEPTLCWFDVISKGYKIISVSNFRDIENSAALLSDIDFSSDFPKRIPDGFPDISKNILFFTSCPDTPLSNEILSLKNSGIFTTITIPDELLSISDADYTVDNEYNFKEVL